MKYNNIKKINYSTIKEICDVLRLNWKTELKLMRNTLKAWLKENLLLLYNHFPNFSFPLTNQLTDIINFLFLAYLENKHADYNFVNIYDILNYIN